MSKAIKDAFVKLLSFLNWNIEKPLDNWNADMRQWSKGYRKAMEDTKEFLENEIEKDGE